MGNKDIYLPKIEDNRGNLTFIEGKNHIPFDIRRTYWIYDVPARDHREGHAYKTQEEFLVALSGSFDLEVFDGIETKNYSLNCPFVGVHVAAGCWRTLKNFSTNSVILVLASTEYNENDYIRDFNAYKKYILNGSK
jgi:hypothetical protein